MTHKLTIGGREIEIGWTQESARRWDFRKSKHGIKIDGKAFTNPARATSAYVECLWLLLPPAEFCKYMAPEELAVVIDHESEAEAIVSGVLSCLTEMVADVEKKSSLKNGPLQESN